MVQRKDLTDIGDIDYHERENEYMQCQNCHEEIGGTRGDYWQMDREHIFTCPTCKSKNLALVKQIYTTKILKQ